MSINLLNDRDYVIILARSGASREQNHPLYEHWLAAQASLIDLAKKCQELDSDGLTVYEASTPLWKYENTDVKRLAEILQRQNTTPDPANLTKIHLQEALSDALSDYFKRKASSKAKKGTIIVVVIDENQEDSKLVAEIIINAANKIARDEEIGISFIQIGEDLEIRKFLTYLDDNLQQVGAKFDIVDTKFWQEIKKSSIVQFLIGAIND
ncbi:hypothetical protein [Kamptonema sp. UHCC 0994]|uniref:hypothetical protein n=1 Tax=Kamptonema sp. UHCC 0994 TaxID=3031329 RepID=UPI0023B930C8|nr:hypothetical protein [Kamptonema sp. UHCC 0994]MDF0552383.1 hypothetical protein [Kamptonema sp. UHCC 0994]